MPTKITQNDANVNNNNVMSEPVVKSEITSESLEISKEDLSILFNDVEIDNEINNVINIVTFFNYPYLI